MQSIREADSSGGGDVETAASGSTNARSAAAVPRHRGLYYAVRSGCGIRSAVFLHWEDARRFVAATGCPSGPTAEYAAFDAMVAAEVYLVAGEREQQAPCGEAGARNSVAAPGAGLQTDPLVVLSNARAKSQRGDDLARQIMAKPDSVRKRCGRKRKPSNNGKHSRKMPGRNTKKNTKEPSKPYNATAKEDGSTTCREHTSPEGDRAKQPDKTKNEAKSKIKRISGDDTLYPVVLSDNATEKDGSTTCGEDISPKGDQAKQSTVWDCMFERLTAHKAGTGTLDVKKNDDGELFTWASTQKKELLHHLQNRPTVLSNERLSKLKAIGYGPVRPGIVRCTGIIDTISAEEKWSATLEALKNYRDRNDGSMLFPETINASSPKPLRDLKYWAMEQRREFRRLSKGDPSSLTAQRLRRLTELGFDMAPIAEKIPWARRVAQLREFVEEHGHCRPPHQHPELGWFVSKVRTKYREREEGKTNNLTDEKVRALTALGFVFSAGKSPNFTSKTRKSWQERFEELLSFKKEHGHTVVPQLSGPLGGWVRMQRIAYKKFRAGEKSTMKLEQALQLSEAGFCFDASAKMGGGPRRPVLEERSSGSQEPAPEESTEEQA